MCFDVAAKCVFMVISFVCMSMEYHASYLRLLVFDYVEYVIFCSAVIDASL